MALPLPFDPQGFPVVNGIMFPGLVQPSVNSSSIANLLGGATFGGNWEDWGAYSEIRVQSFSDVASAVGGILIQWSLGGGVVHATEAPGTALANTLYDSGPIPRRMQYGRVLYTNGVGAQASFRLMTQLFFSPTDSRTREYLDGANVPPLALLAAATYTGGTTAWGPYNKLNLVGAIDQAGTLYIDQSRDNGATWPVIEQWAGAIGETFAFPTARAVGCNTYRLRFTAAGVNLAALVLTPYLTVGEVDHKAPILTTAINVVFPAPGNQVVLRSVGARFFGTTTQEAGAVCVLADVVNQRNAATAIVDVSGMNNAYGAAANSRQYAPTAVDLNIVASAATITGTLYQYA
jgi:hypothetical protein